MDKKKSSKEALKQDFMMAFVMILGALLVSWVVFVNGPRSALDKEEVKLQGLEQTQKERKTVVDPNETTITASQNANRPSTIGTALGRVRFAEAATGIKAKTVTRGGFLEVTIPGNQKATGRFLKNMFGTIKFKTNGQIINASSSPFLSIESFFMTREFAKVTVRPSGG